MSESSDSAGSQGHRARKRFGQNFLKDESIVAQLVAAIGPRSGDHIVEIGPGLGALSKPLGEALRDKGKLTLLEIDRDLAARLGGWVGANPHIDLQEGDALAFNFTALGGSEHTLRAVGNLPYNISTPLLFHLLEQQQRFAAQQGHSALLFADMHFMLQQEVVDRICAQPGGKQYGRLSVMLQYFASVERLFSVPSSAFSPRPAVESAILRIAPYAEPPCKADNEALLSTLVTAAFAQRRKTLRNTLKAFCSAEQLELLSIDPGARAETLHVGDFVKIANAVQ
ncbi:MAG: 16S rRNA (adenine(1518)-N(6)/adenine(1519)-N(6))-dimethyltransferase RsmA, partial [Pseudomonadales bacterium]|nr:16S rRNA (adenine(1518)-N(6)/adenine(1519)-N(6))-dimethyltransferase RsmA [Pseudomonadales bacterium]